MIKIKRCFWGFCTVLTLCNIVLKVCYRFRKAPGPDHIEDDSKQMAGPGAKVDVAEVVADEVADGVAEDNTS